MAVSTVRAPALLGITTCVPSRRLNNVTDTAAFAAEDVRKIVAMAGVAERRVVDEATCSSDLCFAAATDLLDALEWSRPSVDAVIMVTQTPDYIMPSSSCLLQERLGLSKDCAAFDLGLGCSGYVYGLWLASMMLDSGGLRRILLLHGETPTRYATDADRAVALLFGDAGSATALEAGGADATVRWNFALHSDGAAASDLMIKPGGFRHRSSSAPRDQYVTMDGAKVFNFTIKAIPPLIDEVLQASGRTREDVDYFIFHQSNRFIINHLVHKCGLETSKVPITLGEYGNSGGPSVPLTMTRAIPAEPRQGPLTVMLLGYGVGLSWAGCLIELAPSALLRHVEWPLGQATLQLP
jgi:3-oxoacyl-[acyl-carrier-protein] synthase-3